MHWQQCVHTIRNFDSVRGLTAKNPIVVPVLKMRRDVRHPLYLTHWAAYHIIYD